MMSVRAPLGLSPSGPLHSAFSPFPGPTDSPHPRSATVSRSKMPPPDSSTLKTPAPTINQVTSPQVPVAPSPIVSEVGTEFADTEEAVAEEESTEAKRKSVQQQSQQPSRRNSRTSQPATGANSDPISRFSLKVNTNVLNAALPSNNFRDEPQSVIHAPQGFGSFEARDTDSQKPAELSRPSTASSSSKPDTIRADSAGSVKSDSTVTMGTAPEEQPASERSFSDSHVPPTPLQTQLPMSQDWSSTPRAQTRSDLGAFSRPGSSLASIQEGEDTAEYVIDEGEESDASRAAEYFRSAQDEIAALKTALSEIWNLTNTLASLSNHHRQRMYNFSAKDDLQQSVWKSCWKLCQQLYDAQEGKVSSSARPTLDLCREFCAALFETRSRDNETADSVLRVSFELNNHLFNTHDRSLPEQFRERTMDFYATLCHRLMKQKTRVEEDSDSLLRACWALCEMLFNLRQRRRDNKQPDEELLGSAIQACWELCDLFREGWTKIRPERGTPRPSQATFTQAFNQAKRAGFAPLDENGFPKPLPETPTTIFEDTVNLVSPEDPPLGPNILVLGNEALSQIGDPRSVTSTPMPSQVSNSGRPMQVPMSAQPTTRRFWSAMTSVRSASIASVPEVPTQQRSGRSAMSNQTVSNPEDTAFTLLKILFVKAAITTNRGYSHTSADPNLNSLPNFARDLPDISFGTQTWQIALLENYRSAIEGDPSFKNLGSAATVGERGRVNAVEIARVVKGMTSCVYGFGWLRDLYRYVFGFYIEEALKGEDTQKRRSTASVGSRHSS